VAFDGCTPSARATAPRFTGPVLATITSTRNCGSVIRPSRPAIDRALNATRTRVAAIAASTSSACTSGPFVVPRAMHVSVPRRPGPPDPRGQSAARQAPSAAWISASARWEAV
jgi:hypothetical protein